MRLFGRVFRVLFIVVLVLGILAGIVYAMQLDEQVRAQFEGKRWALPARVFARPLDLYVGQQLYAGHLEQELKLLNYVAVADPVETGQFRREKDSFLINTRGFQFAEDMEPARSIKITIAKGKISKLEYNNGQGTLPLMRLEPVLIGNFYPHHKEDRVLIKLSDVSPALLKGLLAVEDKKFYEHQGVNPLAIIRAMVANLKAGHAVQGGSTITQQLVKNFYLSNERSWERKAKEAMMAFLLELRYSKQEILEAYLNEIYLGQDGDRAIHGFGLAAQFYFNRTVRELKSDQIAMLIGLAKGAGYYNPRRFPERAKERRDLVLTVMEQSEAITPREAEQARARALGVSAHRPSGASPFPAYLDLVRLQLQRDYREEDLRSEGLLIFTAMDPIVQLSAESTLVKGVETLEKRYRTPKDKLNAAMVISNIQGGEIIALVGGRVLRYAGYNRAISAQRQVGSVLKPAIYLTALENGGKYGSLSSRISDGPVKVKIGSGKYWEPGNYDHRNMGVVTMLQALTLSRNTPAVRVGVEVGLDKVIDMLNDLGLKKDIPAYPSLLLGALEMSPLELQQIYQTLAAGGSYSPLKSIRSVMNAEGKTLTRYPVSVEQVAKPGSVDLLNFAMYQITVSGTAKSLQSKLPGWKRVAGKTGTTNDKKDSWFAGYSGQHVMTVWVGRDDNKPTRMTGGTGALPIWGDMMKILPTQPLKIGKSSRLVWVKVDSVTGLLYNPSCGKPVTMPFARGSQPSRRSYCAPPPQPVQQPARQPANNGGSWIENLME
jgi:penicillin-binding protein 1B